MRHWQTSSTESEGSAPRPATILSTTTDPDEPLCRRRTPARRRIHHPHPMGCRRTPLQRQKLWRVVVVICPHSML
jgi:hypothetical protein